MGKIWSRRRNQTSNTRTDGNGGTEGDSMAKSSKNLPHILCANSEFKPEPSQFDMERAKEYLTQPEFLQEFYFLQKFLEGKGVDELAADPQTFLDFILTSVIREEMDSGVHPYMDWRHPPTKLLQKLQIDDKLWLVSPDLLHNNYINYYNGKELVVPSRMFIFTKLVDNVQHFNKIKVKSTSPAECILDTCRNSTRDQLLNPLKMIKNMQQEVLITKCRIMSLNDTDEDVSETERREITKLIVDGLKFSKNASHVQIMWSYLSNTAYQHIALQLHGCTKLVHLDLHGSKNVPFELSNALKTMESLSYLNLESCLTTPDSSRSVLSGLSKCQNLKEVNLACNNLTHCVVKLFGEHQGFQVLETLNLRKSQIEKDDMESIIDAACCGKLPKLNTLLLSNNTLTGGFKAPLSNDCQTALPSLEFLDLQNTQMGKCDLENLCNILCASELPKLETLILSNNSLMGGFPCPSAEMTSGQGFHAIQTLKLNQTKLSVSDVRNMSVALLGAKSLQCLDLSQNKLTGILHILGLDSHPSLRNLGLTDTELNEDDINILVDIMCCGKLPNIYSLDLMSFNCTINHMKSITEVYKSGKLPRLANISMSLINEPLSEDDLEDFLREFGKEGMGMTLKIDERYHDFAWNIARQPGVHLSLGLV